MLNAQSSTEIQTLYRRRRAASSSAVAAYKKIVKLQPSDPNVQLELAQAAQQAGDTASAIAAYAKFLKLAPDDPNAPIVKQQLKQLKQTSASVGIDSRRMEPSVVRPAASPRLLAAGAVVAAALLVAGCGSDRRLLRGHG